MVRARPKWGEWEVEALVAHREEVVGAGGEAQKRGARPPREGGCEGRVEKEEQQLWERRAGCVVLRGFEDLNGESGNEVTTSFIVELVLRGKEVQWRAYFDEKVLLELKAMGNEAADRDLWERVCWAMGAGCSVGELVL